MFSGIAQENRICLSRNLCTGHLLVGASQLKYLLFFLICCSCTPLRVHFRSTYTHNSHCDAVERFVELMTLAAGVVTPSPSTRPSALSTSTSPRRAKIIFLAHFSQPSSATFYLYFSHFSFFTFLAAPAKIAYNWGVPVCLCRDCV